jgi:aspartyl-tRNA(Asn)/glutamyl-tRNA(Gln) amidotransferase subunit A
MSAPLAERSVRELKALLDSGKLTSEALVQDCLTAIAHRDPKIKAFLKLNADDALAQAKSIDQKRASGQKLGLLGGLPVAIKDNLCTKGLNTTCSSKMLEHFVPPYSATVVEKIIEADGIPLGKTNLDEFAMGSSTENSAYGPTANPWALDRIPGGSSGGSAAAVAGSMVPLSLGSDTGGSIRQPASLCGINGLKPSYGRVSRYGLVAFASSLDQIGPFSNDLFGTALLLQATAGHDTKDSTSLNQPVPDYMAELDKPISGLRVGVAKEFFGAGLDPEVEKSVRDALKVYESLGAKVVEVSLPNSPHAIATYYLVATAEASSNLARYDGMHYGHRTKEKATLIDTYCKSRGEGLGAEVKRRIMLGTYALSSGYIDAYYTKALKVRRLILQDFEKAFESCDVVVGPTAPTAAFKRGEKSSDPLSMYLSDIYTISCNLAGIAGISIPCGLTSGGLPIGLQLQSAPLTESNLLRAARMFENATEWHTKRPAAALYA